MKKCYLLSLGLMLLACTTWAQGPITVFDVGTPRNLNALDFDGAQVAVVVGDTGFAIRTTDAGQTFVPLSMPTTQNLRGISFGSSTVAVVVGANRTILRSTNAGASWSTVPSPTGIRGGAFARVDLVNATAGYAVGDSGVVVKTIDGGLTWTNTTYNNPGHTHLGLSFWAPDSGYVAGGIFVGSTRASYLYRTYTGGQTWDSIPLPLHINRGMWDVKFLNRNEGYVCGAFNIIMKTVDAGATWSIIFPSAQSSNYMRAMDALPDGKAVFVGDVQGQFRAAQYTTNGGNTFAAVPNYVNATNGRLTDVLLVGGASMVWWATAREGKVVYHSDVNALPDYLRRNPLKLYPNPTRGSFSFSAEAKGSGTLQLVDRTGRTVATWNALESEGQNLSLPSGLASGLYQVLWRQEGQIWRSPLVVE